MSDSAIPWTAAHQASLSFTISQSLLNSCPLSWWCPPSISSSVTPSLPALNLFPVMSRLFVSGGQSIGVSASASVLPENIQCWFPLGLCLVDNCSNYQTKQYSVVQMDICKYGKSTQFWMEILNTKFRLVISLWMRGRREWDGMRKLNNWYLPLQLTLFSTLCSLPGEVDLYQLRKQVLHVLWLQEGFGQWGNHWEFRKRVESILLASSLWGHLRLPMFYQRSLLHSKRPILHDILWIPGVSPFPVPLGLTMVTLCCY